MWITQLPNIVLHFHNDRRTQTVQKLVGGLVQRLMELVWQR